jgi:3-oxoacyl-[acyl-carrier-protein] synthase III
MDISSPVYVSGISYAHGVSRSILDLGDPAIAELANPEHGLACYRSSDQQIWELAGTACPETLAGTPVPPDLLLYVSEHDRDARHALPRLVSKLGIPEIAYIHVSGHGCGNLGPALLFARNMLYSRAYDRVLLVVADRETDGDRSHIRGLSVFSDGAVSCLLTRDLIESAVTRFMLDAAATVTNIGSSITGRNAAGMCGHEVLSMAALAAKGAAAILEESGRGMRDFNHIVFNNYRITTQRFLCSAMGASLDQLLLGPIAEFAHCFSADILVTLDMYAESGQIKSGERVLACTNGLWSLSLLSAECI